MSLFQAPLQLALLSSLLHFSLPSEEIYLDLEILPYLNCT